MIYPKLCVEDIPWESTYRDFTPNLLILEVIERHMNLMIKWIKPEKHNVIIDIGSGKGYLTDLLSSLSGRVVGIDVNKNYIKYSKEKHFRRNVDFIIADVLHLPFIEQSFDVVICRDVIEHVSNPTILLEEIKRVMRLKAILSTPNFNTLPRIIFRKFGKGSELPPGHVQEYTFYTLKALLERKGLNIKRLSGCYMPIPLIFRGRTREKVINSPFLRHIIVTFCFTAAKLLPVFSNYLTTLITPISHPCEEDESIR